MTIERAWSSDKGDQLLYLVEQRGERFGVFNNRGEVSEIHSSEHFDYKMATVVDDNELDEVKLHSVARMLDATFITNGRVQLTEQEQAGNTVRLTVYRTLLNRGFAPNGIEQVCVMSSIVNEAPFQLDTEAPVLLRNGNQIVHLRANPFPSSVEVKDT